MSAAAKVAGRYGVCPVCGGTITRDPRGGLLPHHPGVNAGTARGGTALCRGGMKQ